MPDLPSSANKLGRYEIIREIARSNDIVYEAIDPQLKRRVALKELNIPPNLQGAQRRERIERFYREAKAAGTLTHPNIVTIYEVGQDNDRHFIAMEFLEGQDLQARIAAGGPLPLHEAIEISRQVLSALEFAHSRGVIHRDIKPDNIQLLPNGIVKLTDFGIARIISDPSITADGQVFGTPSYMSPEQVAGGAIDARTDIFSFGIVLYEMLTGRRPFVGDSVITITYNIMHTDPQAPAGLPYNIERVIGKALAKDPNQRYQSAAQMLADIERGDTMTPFSTPIDATSTHGLGTSQSVPPGWSGPAPPPIMIHVPPQSQPIRPAPIAVRPSMLPDPIYQLRPRRRRVKLPSMSDSQRAFLKTLFFAIVISAALVFFVLALLAGYQAYQERTGVEEALAHNNRGVALMQQHRYEEALAELNRAVSMSRGTGQEGQIARNLARCYVEIANRRFDAGDFQGAAASFEAAVEAAPDWAAPYLYLGLAKARLGYEDEAVYYWRMANDMDPGSDEARDARRNIGSVYIRRGDWWAQQGRYAEAAQWYAEAANIGQGTDIERTARDRLQGLPSG
jgi:serine/threonine protein kinase/Tfp pilus assembly protein PilF